MGLPRRTAVHGFCGLSSLRRVIPRVTPQREETTEPHGAVPGGVRAGGGRARQCTDTGWGRAGSVGCPEDQPLPKLVQRWGMAGGSTSTEGVGFLQAISEHRGTCFAHLTPPKAATLWPRGRHRETPGASQPQDPDRCCQQARQQPAGSPGGAQVTRDTDTARHGTETAVPGADPAPRGNEEVQRGRGRPPSRLPETTGMTFGLSDEQRPVCHVSFQLWL